MNNNRISYIFFLLSISFLCLSCKTSQDEQKKSGKDESLYSYTVMQSNKVHDINAEWDKKYWNKTTAISLDHYMGDKPKHFPKTRIKLRYDKDNIYVIFNVKDKYVKAVEKEINGKVWHDSCVEFFFCPGLDIERGYFNFEANCKGVFLFQYHVDNGKKSGFVSMADCNNVKISHSLKRNVVQETIEPLNWSLEYCIPISVLKKYMKVDVPGPGVRWRANFYKCADKSSHPHWLTWAFVDFPKPKFHLPEFFGWLHFE
jgi:hypothetical protein